VKIEWTPWFPILVTAVATYGAAWLVVRLTGNRGFAWPAAFLVLALASAVLAQIATIAYVWAGTLALMAVVGFVLAWRR
jgi:hypothetical protein